MTAPSERTAEVQRPSAAARYRLAAVLALVGLLAAGAWVFASFAGTAADPAAFTRIAPAGPAVMIDRPGSYVVYYESPYGMMMRSDPGVSVTDPDGRAVPMQPGYGVRYAVPGRPGCYGRMVGRFHADRPGRYRMVAGRSDPQATIALSPDRHRWPLPNLLGAITLLVVTTGAAVALAVSTRYRR